MQAHGGTLPHSLRGFTIVAGNSVGVVMASRTWRERPDQILKWVGVLSLLIFGSLFILTLVAPVPAFAYWLTGAALYPAVAFLFASVIGVLGLKNIISRSIFWAGVSLALLLTGAAWWQAAEQGASAAQQAKLNKETNDLVKQIARAVGADPDGPVKQVAQAVIEQLKQRVSLLEARGNALVAIGVPSWAEAEGVPSAKLTAVGLMTINYGGVKSGIVIGAAGDDVTGIVVVPLSRQGGLNQPYGNPTAHTDLGTHRWYMSQVTGAYVIAVFATRKSPITIRYRFEDQTESNSITW